MIKNEKQIINTSNNNFQDNINIKKFDNNSNIIKEERHIQILRLVINLILSLILIAVFIYAILTYNPLWRVFYFLASWSYIMNIFYVLSITTIDILYMVYNKLFEQYNNFIRNYFIRICIPFSITSVFVYWELILLGSNFEKIGDDAYDYSANIFLNGIVLVFLFFDMFTSCHVYKHNRINDVIILTIIIMFYYLLLCLGKYLEFFEPYDFMMRSDVRQIIGVGIIVYLLVLNGYIVFDLLAFCCFKHENKKNKNLPIIDDKNEVISSSINYNSLIDKENFTNKNTNLNEFSSHLKTIYSASVTAGNNPLLKNGNLNILNQNNNNNKLVHENRIYKNKNATGNMNYISFNTLNK